MTLSSAALRAAKDGWAVGPVEAPAILRATGKDAKDYLHRMTTQDLNVLPPGGSAYTTVLNAKGHLLADAHALVEADGVLLIMDPRGAADARPHLENFVIMDDVVFEDLSATVRVIPVVGPESAARLGTRAATPRRISNRRRGVPALDFVVPVEDAGPFRAELVREGAFELGEGDLEALRILEGQARFGADMDASRLPMEAGLTRLAISFSKGRYTGQEVVLRATPASIGSRPRAARASAGRGGGDAALRGGPGGRGRDERRGHAGGAARPRLPAPRALESRRARRDARRRRGGAPRARRGRRHGSELL